MADLLVTNCESYADNSALPGFVVSSGSLPLVLITAPFGRPSVSGTKSYGRQNQGDSAVYTASGLLGDQALRTDAIYSGNAPIGHLLRSNGTTNPSYRAFPSDVSGTWHVTLAHYNAGTVVLENFDTGMAATVGDNFHFESSCLSNTLAARFWLGAAQRPSSPTVSHDVSTVVAPMATGYPGIICASNTFEFVDNIVITDGTVPSAFDPVPGVTIAGAVGNASAASPTAAITQSGTATITASVGNASGVSPLAAVSTRLLTDYIINNTGTRRTNQAVSYSWFPGGRIGSFVGITPLEGTGTTDATGRFAPGINRATGLLLTCVRNADATADDVYYEAFA